MKIEYYVFLSESIIRKSHVNGALYAGKVLNTPKKYREFLIPYYGYYVIIFP